MLKDQRKQNEKKRYYKQNITKPIQKYVMYILLQPNDRETYKIFIEQLDGH